MALLQVANTWIAHQARHHQWLSSWLQSLGSFCNWQWKDMRSTKWIKMTTIMQMSIKCSPQEVSLIQLMSTSCSSMMQHDQGLWKNKWHHDPGLGHWCCPWLFGWVLALSWIDYIKHIGKTDCIMIHHDPGLGHCFFLRLFGWLVLGLSWIDAESQCRIATQYNTAILWACFEIQGTVVAAALVGLFFGAGFFAASESHKEFCLTWEHGRTGAARKQYLQEPNHQSFVPGPREVGMLCDNVWYI